MNEKINLAQDISPIISEINTPPAKENEIINPPQISPTPQLQAAEKNEYNDEEFDEMSDELKECTKEGSTSRSSRGLRVLSVRVRELVFEKRITTYKEVADELIKELVEEGKMAHDSHNVNFFINKRID